ncbi:hypothetical protein MmiHf6_17360 [Methanimicrococcus hongohii]|uniref:Uncharacterized protein n=1 Tax=Methanimicrococcus hongohii TaxID=3028295 RepID=A0AA96V2Y4_9EURY|nr:hypothetical protein MmiHf6_17360 [Methanimicrococcus sp. Hf6]
MCFRVQGRFVFPRAGQVCVSACRAGLCFRVHLLILIIIRSLRERGRCYLTVSVTEWSQVCVADVTFGFAFRLPADFHPAAAAARRASRPIFGKCSQNRHTFLIKLMLLLPMAAARTSRLILKIINFKIESCFSFQISKLNLHFSFQLRFSK